MTGPFARWVVRVPENRGKRWTGHVLLGSRDALGSCARRLTPVACFGAGARAGQPGYQSQRLVIGGGWATWGTVPLQGGLSLSLIKTAGSAVMWSHAEV